VSDTGSRDAFLTAYEAWRCLAFPPGSPNDDLDELHADIALADTWVANSVIPYVTDGVAYTAGDEADIIRDLQNLRSRAETLAMDSVADEVKLALDYLDYVDALLAVFERFIAVR